MDWRVGNSSSYRVCSNIPAWTGELVTAQATGSAVT